ncbi:DEAD/DEAH box helicase family protein [Methylocystis sp. WRRC1]|uniref:DEAD/DEAH box helicase n=1 Tax=Methylocystis sp. WRRC1 TaxID=1732014 RepID=UPI001D136BF0|nr:DEAD/DEAH box helicase family protein [Methylocystis sp. WRRC1]MCC3246415.1 DEAD/DEAH box helicase family protein [Methylocystis sp. WRRC1]
MKFELKDFQTTSARGIITKLGQARQGVSSGELEAIVLSAPTGSGKTITVAAVIDWMFGGADGLPARPNTTFLWLSDSPELNQQSKGKLLAACDYVPFHRLVTVDSESFDEERLAPGYVYFINTQLLGKDKLLTKGGDKKTFTFWQTVANTIAAAPEDFVLIIDEAHRGSGVTDRARKPIMQKFITGSDADGLPPVPLVLGMSATPQRFTELLGNTTRTQRPVNITAEMVRQSGLLKDLIIVTTNKSTTVESDLTHLQNAAARWKHFRDRWEAYCSKEKEKAIVKPVLVVQVQDGTESTLTATPLHDVVKVIQRVTGPLAVNEIVHCFQEKEEISYGGCIIRRMDASRIQDSPDVKVVLFKTALTTGWDCPRAEVMMSFRRSVDATTIAQLVGRMIRTPLARRIESDEALNTVELFLPHYDTENLTGVLNALRSPEAHEGVPSDVTTQAVEYPRNPAFADVFGHLAKLTTYSVNRAPKMTDVKRSLRLAGMLVHQGIDQDADERLRNALTAKLKELRDNYEKNDPQWEKMVREGGEIDVDVTAVATGDMTVSKRHTTRFALSEENIEQLFDEAGRKLAAGEGLHRSYWKRYHAHDEPTVAKLELAAVLRQGDALPVLEKLARTEFEKLWATNKGAIKQLPASESARFTQLVQSSGQPVAQQWELPNCIVEKSGDFNWKDHLFANEKGEFSATLNAWESEFLAYVMGQKDFLCWLRNLDRREWAFCVPYELGGDKPFFPDFVIVRKNGSSYEVDVLEPHDDSRTDTWAKVKGLAKFAEQHHMDFGRLMVGRKKDGKLQVVDVSDDNVRQKALKMGAPADLEALFDQV